MADVFLSYSRRDQAFVRRLHAALEGAGKDNWVDGEGVPPTARWMEEVRAAIDAADAFVYVVSPDSAGSSVCRQEAEHALAVRKGIVPVVWRDTPETDLPEAITGSPRTATGSSPSETRNSSPGTWTRRRGPQKPARSPTATSRRMSGPPTWVTSRIARPARRRPREPRHNCRSGTDRRPTGRPSLSCGRERSPRAGQRSRAETPGSCECRR